MACCAPLNLSFFEHTVVFSLANYLLVVFFFPFSSRGTRTFPCAHDLHLLSLQSFSSPLVHYCYPNLIIKVCGSFLACNHNTLDISCLSVFTETLHQSSGFLSQLYFLPIPLITARCYPVFLFLESFKDMPIILRQFNLHIFILISSSSMNFASVSRPSW